MALSITKEIAALKKMSTDELRSEFGRVFGEATNGRHKEWLIKRIIWRLQANAEGDLSERARRRAAELANDADLRVTVPRSPKQQAYNVHTMIKPAAIKCDHRLPMPGTVITREYQGQTLSVKVLRDGFEFNGDKYKSLSAIAKVVTGSHWSGPRFFNIQKKGGEK